MAFDDRLLFLLLGVVIGFVFGYLTRLMQGMKEIKEELDEVDEIVKENLGSHHDDDYKGAHMKPFRQNEKGFMKLSSRQVANVAVLLLVGLAFYASVVSQKASNDATDSQERMEQIVSCNRTTMTAVLESLNERSTYTVEMARANIDLQTSQSKFFAVLLHEPPYSEARRARAVQEYYADLQTFLTLAEKNQGQLAQNQFPTIEEFEDCLQKKLKGSST